MTLSNADLAFNFLVRRIGDGHYLAGTYADHAAGVNLPFWTADRNEACRFRVPQNLPGLIASLSVSAQIEPFRRIQMGGTA